MDYLTNLERKYGKFAIPNLTIMLIICFALGYIMQMMQGDKCDIDRLTDYTRRATELLTECRSRLTTTDEQLRSILSQLENK